MGSILSVEYKVKQKVQTTDVGQVNGRAVTAIVIVAALGYFVDIYDLLLFSIIRVPSLQSLGLNDKDITTSGIMLLNVQMVGMLIGGILWGILGDKKGRLTVLFGSILLYSIANVANGFVTTVEGYSLWRFVAGIGLAGELGAGITLVAEVMPKEKRGYGTTIVAAVGISGAVVAFFLAKLFTWRTSYFIGGGLGIALLILRIGVAESKMFARLKNKHVTKGNFLQLFAVKDQFLKYMRCIVIGVPLWFVVGILITLSPEFGKVLKIQGKVDAGAAVACCYAGLVVGDIISGLLSQWFKSRKKVVYIFLSLTVIAVACYFLADGISLSAFYTICFVLGLSVGYWVIFMTVAAEQFGTNIRATVTTTVPNFVRAAVIPLSFLFQVFQDYFGNSIIIAGAILGIICLCLSFWSLYYMEETFHKNLDFIEGN